MADIVPLPLSESMRATKAEFLRLNARTEPTRTRLGSRIAQPALYTPTKVCSPTSPCSSTRHIQGQARTDASASSAPRALEGGSGKSGLILQRAHLAQLASSRA